MRFAFLVILLAAALSLSAAPPLAQPESGPTSTVPPAAADAGKDVVHQLNSAFTKVFEIVSPTVVIIEVTKKNDGPDTSALDDLFNFPSPQDESAPRRGPRNPQPIQSEGSGFIVRADGFIYTNYHVVEGADQVDVKLKDGREFKAKVVGTDEKTDIAVIKIEATNLPVAQFANSDNVRVGQFAFAIGAPFKLDYTFTYGVISGKGRSKLIATGGYSISDYLQTDASINPGNSGGPLIDAAGLVLGVNTCVDSRAVSIGFAVPGETVDWVVRQILQYGDVRRGALGVAVASRIENVDGQLRHAPVITRVSADLTCDLRPGDIIIGLAGRPVRDRADLYYLLTRDMIGTLIPVELWRQDCRVRCDVPVREYVPPAVVNPD